MEVQSTVGVRGLTFIQSFVLRSSTGRLCIVVGSVDRARRCGVSWRGFNWTHTADPLSARLGYWADYIVIVIVISVRI